MRFAQLNQYATTKRLQGIASFLQEFNTLNIGNDIVFEVTAMLKKANIPHYIADRFEHNSRIEVFETKEAYQIAMEKDHLPKKVYAVIVPELARKIDFYHPDHTWVELNNGEEIDPKAIKTAMKEGWEGISDPYNEDAYFKVNREWHIRRVIHLVQHYDDTPIQIVAKETEDGYRTPDPIIGDGKHRFMAAVVRGDIFIGATFNSLIVKEALIGV